MVLSDNTGVVDDGEVCVEAVDDDCFWEFAFLVFGFACSGPFSSFFFGTSESSPNPRNSAVGGHTPPTPTVGKTTEVSVW